MAAPDHQRVRKIFLRAVELPTDAVPAFLAETCGEDERLREEVESLLDHHTEETLLAARVPAQPVPQQPGGVDPRSNLSRLQHGTQSLSETLTRQLARNRRGVLTTLLVGLPLLGLLGYWVERGTRRVVRTMVQETVETILEQQVHALQSWLGAEERLVQSWARSPRLRDVVQRLKSVAEDSHNDPETLRQSSERAELDAILKQLSADEHVHYALWSRDAHLIADSSLASPGLGKFATEHGAALLTRVGSRQTGLWLPTRKGYITRDYVPPEGPTAPGLAVLTIVMGDNNRALGFLLVSGPELQQRFDSLLNVGQFLDSGETYTFSDDGYLISESRFLEQLLQVGLIEARSTPSSAAIVRVADPGGNLLKGHRNPLPRAEWPLTRMASAAVAGRNGSDFDGYRDYRGVEVVGAWKWLPDYQFGIATEVDYSTVYAPLRYLHLAFGLLLGGLTIASLGAAWAALAYLGVRRDVVRGHQVGPYRIDRLLGEGGLGRVYLAHHDLLKRPTAIKVIRPDMVTEQNLRRFEREVRLASQLTHPNTIEIYDYGHTPEGLFFTAMEYIEGLNLQELIDLEGHVCPERVVWILESVCRSLKEAHDRDLVHRDIKPQNIMVCQRGGESDVVKVLDFGLAREHGTQASLQATDTRVLVGTPMYIAPERITDPACLDPRSDIFALGVVGFNLLTGRAPFGSVGAIEALAQTMNRPAPVASSFVSTPIPAELDRLIADCQERDPAARPQSMSEVLDRLQAVPLGKPWTQDRAAALVGRASVGPGGARSTPRRAGP